VTVVVQVFKDVQVDGLLAADLIIVTVATPVVVDVIVVVVSLLVVVGAEPMLDKVGNPVGIPDGMQRDPPQVSPFGQQAVTPLNTQVG
jgi:hypothetical protein